MTSPTVLPVRQRTPEWLEARMDGIGASEAAAAVGLSQWQSRIGLWAHKLGLTPAPEPTMPMLLGVELEPFIARKYTEQTGVKIRRANNLRQHPEHGFMIASIDRRAGRRPVELKFSVRATGYGEPGTDEVPDDVLVQVLHQLAVLDEPEGDVALLRPGRDEVAIYPIRREADAEAVLVEREAIFWDAVQSRTEPPIDGSAATRETLNALYQRIPDTVVAADQAVHDDMVLLRAVRRDIDSFERERAELEARIKAAMLRDQATVVRASGVGEITWRQPKDSTKTDWKLVAAAYRGALEQITDLMADATAWPEELEAVVRNPEAIESLHTETKANTPRFTPKWEGEEE